MQKSVQPLPKSLNAQPFCSLSASVCITSRKGLHLCHGEQQPGAGIWYRPGRSLHNIPEGLAVAGPVYAATGSNVPRFCGRGFPDWLKFSVASGVVNSWQHDFSGSHGGNHGAVAGIMVALSVDELMPLAKESTPIITPVMACYVECQ